MMNCTVCGKELPEKWKNRVTCGNKVCQEKRKNELNRKRHKLAYYKEKARLKRLNKNKKLFIKKFKVKVIKEKIKHDDISGILQLGK